MRIRKQNTFAVVIDYQERILPAMDNWEELLRKSEILLKGLKAMEIPMVLTTQYAKGLGDNVSAITDAMGVTEAIDKGVFSVYASDDVKAALPHGRKNVIICGIEAHICVLQTVIDMKEAGYQPILVADCISSRSSEDKKYALIRAQQEITAQAISIAPDGGLVCRKAGETFVIRAGEASVRGLYGYL